MYVCQYEDVRTLVSSLVSRLVEEFGSTFFEVPVCEAVYMLDV